MVLYVFYSLTLKTDLKEICEQGLVCALGCVGRVFKKLHICPVLLHGKMINAWILKMEAKKTWER